MPRLYREAPVNAIWEGSGNVQCLDIARAIQRSPQALEAYFAEVGSAKGDQRRARRACRGAEGRHARSLGFRGRAAAISATGWRSGSRPRRWSAPARRSPTPSAARGSRSRGAHQLWRADRGRHEGDREARRAAVGLVARGEAKPEGSSPPTPVRQRSRKPSATTARISICVAVSLFQFKPQLTGASLLGFDLARALHQIAARRE